MTARVWVEVFMKSKNMIMSTIVNTRRRDQEDAVQSHAGVVAVPEEP